MKKKRRLLSVARCTVKKSAYLILGLLLAFPAWAQAAKDPVSLTVKRQSVVEIFKELEKQSHYRFMFHDEDLLRLGEKNIDVKNAPLTEVLDNCLAGSNIGYEIVGNQIVFKRTAVRQQAEERRRVTGTIVDASGKPIVGAAVTVEGTTIGTSSDAYGNFRLYIPSGEDVVLSVTFIGFKTNKVTAGTRQEFRIVMEEGTIGVDEVIVTGYANIDKNSYAGSVFQVKGEDIMVAGESSIDGMLQGVVPGMAVVNTSGRLGSSPKIRIRGTSTILGNQEPLWVVDGVIQRDPIPLPDDGSALSAESDMLLTAANAISWLNPNDVETITILKDASATAIYGSQAGNGVIVITTKKAKSTGLTVNYSGNFTVGQKPGYHLYDMMNSQELMQFAQEMYEDRNSYTQRVLPIGYAALIERLQSKNITQEEFNREFRKMETQNTDWFDLLFKNNFSQAHNISVAGGGDKIFSRFSIGMNDQRGEAKGNDNKSFTASSNTTFRIDDRVIIDLQLSGSMREASDFAYNVDPYGYAMNTSRTIPMYNEDGTYFYTLKSGNTSNSIPGKLLYNYNIQNELDNTGITNKTASIQSSLNLRVKLLKGLEFQAMASYSVASSEGKQYATEFSNHISTIRGYEFGEVLPNSNEQKASILPFGGVVVIQNAMNYNYSVRSSLLYNKSFNDAHNLTLQLGFELQSASQEGNTNTRYGYLHYRGERFATVPREFVPISGASTNWTDLHEAMRAGTRIVNTKNNSLSEYFTAVYNYKSRYILNFNTRLDASNRFGQDQNKKFNPSWSLGLKWRLGNESFMDWTQSWLDMLDVSASYGYRGNAVQQVSPYLIATDGGFSQQFYQYTLAIKSLPYPNLGWEKKKDWNLSLDFSFLKSRITATVEAYGAVTKALSSREVPVENGVNNALISGTKVKNRGYELIVGFVPVRTENFMWQFSINTARNFNKLENNQRVNTREDYLNGSAIVNGEAYSTFWGFAFNGLNPENGIPTFKYMDIERTDIDLDYMVKLGKLDPDFSGGLSTMFRYKRLFLRANFAMLFGAQKALPSVYPPSGAPTPEMNAPRYLFDRWRKPGDNTNIPAVPPGASAYVSVYLPTPVEGTQASMNAYRMYDKSDIMTADADFIRCRQISLQYDLPVKISSSIRAKRISVSASMTNPFFIAIDKKWNGRDPEAFDGWPARRTTSFSINLTF